MNPLVQFHGYSSETLSRDMLGGTMLPWRFLTQPQQQLQDLTHNKKGLIKPLTTTNH